jgi:putative transposase
VKINGQQQYLWRAVDQDGEVVDVYLQTRRDLMPDVTYNTERYANNRAEQSHESTRVRDRGMRRFRSPKQAQRFLSTHAAVYNLFIPGRHLVRAEHYRNPRISALREWKIAAA